MELTQRIIVACARTPRDVVIEHCVEDFGLQHSDLELKESEGSVLRFEGVRPEHRAFRMRRSTFMNRLASWLPLPPYNTKSCACVDTWSVAPVLDLAAA